MMDEMQGAQDAQGGEGAPDPAALQKAGEVVTSALTALSQVDEGFAPILDAFSKQFEKFLGGGGSGPVEENAAGSPGAVPLR